MTEDNLRNRSQRTTNNNYQDDKETNKRDDSVHNDPDFRQRESILTDLKASSAHIRAIYHIFVVILILLLFETAVFDFVESGKLNIGLTTVRNGFGDIKRAVKLWLYEFLVTLCFYPGLRLYAAGVNNFKKNPGLSRIWCACGAAGFLAQQMALIAVPVWDLGREHLALGSSVAVTCEMFRFMMKTYEIAKITVSHCYGDKKPLPSFKQFLYFLFAPTLLYRDKYPRTKKIRWNYVIYNFSEVAAIIFYNSFLWERFILPYWSDFGKEPKVEMGALVRGMFACVMPGVISFLCGHYCLLHAWSNAFAEMMTFGDRLFYDAWWTTSHYSKFYRQWNRVVYSWLHHNIHEPLKLSGFKVWSTLTVFFVSAVAHELIISLSFGFFYPILLIFFGFSGIFLGPLTATAGRKYPNLLNLLLWLSFFFGNGMLWSLYPMEHFARQNCPPSEDDSFFKPKSWSCPEIVFKANWTFQNPFEL